MVTEQLFSDFLAAYDFSRPRQGSLKEHLKWSAKQVRRKDLDVNKVARALIKSQSDFARLHCFSDIHFFVQVITNKMPGCGSTYVYDLSRLISNWFDFRQKILYVHRRNLRALSLLGISVNQCWVEKKDLPPYFQKVDLEVVEDFLRVLS